MEEVPIEYIIDIGLQHISSTHTFYQVAEAAGVGRLE